MDLLLSFIVTDCIKALLAPARAGQGGAKGAVSDCNQ